MVNAQQLIKIIMSHFDKTLRNFVAGSLRSPKKAEPPRLRRAALARPVKSQSVGP
jgi:hypothetical protein